MTRMRIARYRHHREVVIVRPRHSYWTAPVRAMAGMVVVVVVVCWLTSKWTALAVWSVARWAWSTGRALWSARVARELPEPAPVQEAEEPVVVAAAK